MPFVRCLAGVCTGLLAVLVPVACAAQTAAPPDRGPFRRGTLGVEFAGLVAPEAWNMNGSHEWFFDGSFSVWWSFTDGLTLVAELHAAPVTQARPRTAFITAFSTMTRIRILDRGRTAMFVDGGAGVAWSDTTVPPRGTRFNFLIITSIGVTRQLTRQTTAVASLRLVHLSNANRAGPQRNPDIEALGGYFGFCMGF
jgi:hypothetical protein